MKPSIRLGLLCLLLAYLVVGLLFAVQTPAWQAPDEPAHYNYIAHIAQGKGLPVLQMGDYDQGYLERAKQEKFPPALSITSIRYEFHQPPLYYLTAAPIFRISHGSLLVLRLYSLLLGAGVVLVTFLCVHAIFPNRPAVSLSATAFSALLPMHVAMMAAVNNDPLAELIIVSALLVLLHWMGRTFRRPGEETGESGTRSAASRSSLVLLVFLGILTGLGLVTKATAYILLPLALLVVGARSLSHNIHSQQPWRTALKNGLAVALPALLIGLPLWVRNIARYGGIDFLGLNRHAQVVAGQPRTADWIAAHGWIAYWIRAWDFTFKSFWGVFGWLGVFLDPRLYTVLLIVSTILVAGLVWALVRTWRGRVRLRPFQRWSLGLLAGLLLAVLASYAWYNLHFLQHQGRYLFPGLVALATFAAIGWHEALRPRPSLVIGGLLLGVAGFIAGSGWVAGRLDKWTVLLLGLSAGLLLVNGRLSGRVKGRWQWLDYLLPALLLFLLDALIPFVYIVPQLRR